VPEQITLENAGHDSFSFFTFWAKKWRTSGKKGVRRDPQKRREGTFGATPCNAAS